MITGATAGIGRAAALEMARLGASMVVVARNASKAESLKARVTEASVGASVRTFLADLSSLEQVRRVAAEIAEQVGRIDVLVNNAGIAASRNRSTGEGFDEMLASNYLGPFLLTHLLTGSLRASAPARVVIVGSEAHRLTGRFDPERFEQMGSYSGLNAQLRYGRTKLLDLLWADHLARLSQGSGFTVNSLCPGFVATELVRESRLAERPMQVLSATPIVYTPEQGARMTVRLASDPSLEGVTGGFFSSTPGMGRLPKVRARRDPAIAERVYERTLQLIGAGV